MHAGCSYLAVNPAAWRSAYLHLSFIICGISAHPQQEMLSSKRSQQSFWLLTRAATHIAGIIVVGPHRISDQSCHCKQIMRAVIKQLMSGWSSQVAAVIPRCTVGAALQLASDLSFLEAALQPHCQAPVNKLFRIARSQLEHKVLALLSGGGDAVQEVQEHFGDAWASCSVAAWIAEVAKQVTPADCGRLETFKDAAYGIVAGKGRGQGC